MQWIEAKETSTYLDWVVERDVGGTTPNDRTVGKNKTAEKMATFILNWCNKFGMTNNIVMRTQQSSQQLSCPHHPAVNQNFISFVTCLSVVSWCMLSWCHLDVMLLSQRQSLSRLVRVLLRPPFAGPSLKTPTNWHLSKFEISCRQETRSTKQQTSEESTILGTCNMERWKYHWHCHWLLRLVHYFQTRVLHRRENFLHVLSNKTMFGKQTGNQIMMQ